MFQFFSRKINKQRKNRTRKFKKLNCSPIVAGKTPVKESCLTPDILNKIKDQYNKDHTDNPINKKTLSDVWYELHNRLTECDSEECWLKELDDEEMKEQIQQYIFAPKQPPEWAKNPNEWLSNFELDDVMKQYEERYKCFEFLHPTTIDFDEKKSDTQCVSNELCNFSLESQIDNKKTKIGIIFNLDKSTESGSHWVSLFIDIENKFIFFFDSAGSYIPDEIKVFVDRVIEQGKQLEKKIRFKFYENYPFEHQQGNTECGMYSLFFIITMLTGEYDGKKLKTAREKINFFKRKLISDKYVEKYRNIYFNK
jgi:hypothetical protein